jgi:(p)ppGpp synthase/HD superfamily hydrolase
LTKEDILFIEEWLTAAFAGLRRKSGGPMADHSIRVGRALQAAGEDDITVFGGYFHDAIEDLKDRGVTQATVHDLALKLFDNAITADEAAALVVECSYADAEYTLPKLERKAAACARWVATPNQRVASVKIADVRDNKATASQVAPPFEANYLAWAEPLRLALEEIVARRSETRAAV